MGVVKFLDNQIKNERTYSHLFKSYETSPYCYNVMRGTETGKRSEEGAALAPRPPPQRVATISQATNYHEKTTLLSSDDEFQ
ncbi:unnamed protein product [Leptosia nina]|uniref:Uncharacterized protein n=1 Tax=Leptosia nina TaxID=320188 RepID=A0AAV1J905_9NEOP